MRQNSNYPRDVVDALMLAVKESAHDCKLECFVEVFCLALNPIYTGIFGASWGYQSRQKKKKKTGQPVTNYNRKFFFSGYGPEKTSFDISKVAGIQIGGS